MMAPKKIQFTQDCGYRAAGELRVFGDGAQEIVVHGCLDGFLPVFRGLLLHGEGVLRGEFAVGERAIHLPLFDDELESLDSQFVIQCFDSFCDQLI